MLVKVDKLRNIMKNLQFIGYWSIIVASSHKKFFRYAWGEQNLRGRNKNLLSHLVPSNFEPENKIFRKCYEPYLSF